mgnify:CR=1 FL=1
MKTLLALLAMIAAPTDKSVDPVSFTTEQIIKKVYDAKRSKTVEANQEKHPKN